MKTDERCRHRWRLEREVRTPEGRVASQIMDDRGWEVGLFQDSEWDGHSPCGHLVALAPQMLELLEAIAKTAESINGLQHSGAPVPPGSWSNLYRQTNEARAVISAAHDAGAGP